MGGLNSYDNCTKAAWRTWQWEKIVELLPGYHKNISYSARQRLCSEKTVLYLCGPDDFDRHCGLNAGFTNYNLIACDLDGVAHVRASGGLGISCDFVDAIYMWPHDWKIDVVVADFCSNISNHSLLLQQAMIHSGAISKSTVLSINLLRGREHDWVSKANSTCMQIVGDEAPFWCDGGEFVGNYKNLISLKCESPELNRALLWLGMLPKQLCEFFAWLGLEQLKAANCALFEFIESINLWSPAFHTYKSKSKGGIQVFDSVVFRWPIDGFPSGRRKQSDNYWNELRKHGRKRFNRQSCIASLAGLRAHRNKLLSTCEA